jgi:osmotically-inducible protein OsmY
MPITTAVQRALIALLAVMAVALPAASQIRAPVVAQKPDEKRPDAYDMDDSRLTARIEVALFADERIKARWVSVAAVNGDVTLSGQVESADARDAASAITEAVAGVRTVQNNLQLLAPEQGQIASGIRHVAA